MLAAVSVRTTTGQRCDIDSPSSRRGAKRWPAGAAAMLLVPAATPKFDSLQSARATS
jgi:hypothetical protein